MKMPDENGYPTPEELEKIRKWKLPEESVKDLVEFLREIWWMPDWGFHLYKTKDGLLKKYPVMRLELHTGGWSGNEEIIGVLQHPLRDGMIDNYFWMFYWRASLAGGHYYFEIPKDMWR